MEPSSPAAPLTLCPPQTAVTEAPGLVVMVSAADGIGRAALLQLNLHDQALGDSPGVALLAAGNSIGLPGEYLCKGDPQGTAARVVFRRLYRAVRRPLGFRSSVRSIIRSLLGRLDCLPQCRVGVCCLVVVDDLILGGGQQLRQEGGNTVVLDVVYGHAVGQILVQVGPDLHRHVDRGPIPNWFAARPDAHQLDRRFTLASILRKLTRLSCVTGRPVISM